MDQPSDCDQLDQEGYDGAEVIPRRSRLGARNRNGKRNVRRLSPEAEGVLEETPTYSRTFTSISDRIERSFTIYPKEWILKVGIRLGARLVISHSLSGCKWRLELIRVDPGDLFSMTLDEPSRTLVVLDHRGVRIHSKTVVALLVSLSSMAILLSYCWIYKQN
jgi:hypothetical protein